MDTHTLRRFDGRHVLVLGGGADGPPREDGKIAMGNGRAIAMRLASEGAKVSIVDVKEHLAAETVEVCGGTGVAIGADLSRPEECARLVRDATDALGPIDVVVANAAISSNLPLSRQTIEDWERSMSVNVTGHWLVAQAVIEEMTNRRTGNFVFVGSTAGELSPGRSVSYEATKAAQMAVMRHIAVRYGQFGVRSNAVVLGIIDSAMVRREFGADPGALAARDSVSPMRRQGTPEEVAGVAAFLASDDASYVNGQEILVDGGVSASWPRPPKSS